MWSRTVSSLDARAVIPWLALAIWPVHLVFGTCVIATVAFSIALGQQGVVTGVALVTLQYGGGLCGSFALHELGHALTLIRAPGVTAITLERTVLRISVRPWGVIRGRDAFVSALAGPLLCVAVGVALWLIVPLMHLHPWYLLHAIFAVPVFNDGRIMLEAVRSWNASTSREP